jgi:hypothetical protein
MKKIIRKVVKKVFHHESDEIRRSKAMIQKEINKIGDTSTACYVALISIVDMIAISTIGEQAAKELDLTVYNMPSSRLGYYNYKKNLIGINKRYVLRGLKEQGSTYYFDLVLETIFHECRHAWQYNNGWDIENHISGHDDYSAYMHQRHEVDARDYAHREMASLSLEDKEAIFRRILSTMLYFNNN